MKHMRAAKFHKGSVRQIRHLVQANSALDNRGTQSVTVGSHCFWHKKNCPTEKPRVVRFESEEEEEEEEKEEGRDVYKC